MLGLKLNMLVQMATVSEYISDKHENYTIYLLTAIAFLT